MAAKDLQRAVDKFVAHPSASQLNAARAAWLAAFLLGFLHIAGEEVSWGQHWFGWATPDWLAHLNLYGETILHNLSYAMDRVANSILGIQIVVFGLLRPLWL